MRISDWSSDVCSSDLSGAILGACDLRHGLPRTPAYGRAARADLSDHQALPGRDGARGDQPGAVSGHDGKSQDRSLMPRGAALSALPLPSACPAGSRSEEHTSELPSLMRRSYDVFCLKQKTKTN